MWFNAGHRLTHFHPLFLCVRVRAWLYFKGESHTLLSSGRTCLVKTPFEALQVNTKPSFEKTTVNFPLKGNNRCSLLPLSFSDKKKKYRSIFERKKKYWMTWRGKKETKIKPSLFELPSSCQRGCMNVFKVRASSRALFIKDTNGADDQMHFCWCAAFEWSGLHPQPRRSMLLL